MRLLLQKDQEWQWKIIVVIKYIVVTFHIAVYPLLSNTYAILILQYKYSKIEKKHCIGLL